MALTTALDIINAALVAIGEAKLTTGELAAGILPRAQVANQLYDETVDEVLADSFWGFAKRYQPLFQSALQPIYIPGEYTLAFDLPDDFIRPVRLANGEQFDLYSYFDVQGQTRSLDASSDTSVSIEGHALIVGDYLILLTGDQAGETRRVVVVVDDDELVINAAFSEDQAPGTSWAQLTGDRQRLITDTTTPILEYIARVASPAAWSPLFKQSIIIRLASKFALAITHSRALSVSLFEEYQLMLVGAEVVSGQSTNRPRKIESTILVDVRRGAR